MLQEAEAYNKTLLNGVSTAITDAFSDSNDNDSVYNSLLDIGVDGTMGYISIPSIDVSLPIYHGTSESVLQKGAGHLQWSSLPVGGKGTHTCISAHRGLPQKTMFTNLDLLKEGDVFYITVLDRKIAYEVYSIEVVEPTDVDALKIDPDQDIATLITCTPYGVNSHRMYVHGKRIPYEKTEEKTLTIEDGKAWIVLYWWIPATIFLLILLIILLLYYLKPVKPDDSEEESEDTQPSIPG